MKVIILKTCIHDGLGKLTKGQEVDVHESIAKIWESQGGCEILEATVEEPVVEEPVVEEPIELAPQEPIETKVVHNKPRKG